MFSYYCIIIACLLYGNAVKEYRFIALAVFVEFLLHKLAYNHLFLDFRSGEKWFIFCIYASIQLPIMVWLARLKCHFVISGLIFINMIYNLSTSLVFFYPEFIEIYYAKDAFIGTIMIMELFYLGLLSQYVRTHITKRFNISSDYIDRIFRVRGWRNGGDLA